MKSKLLILAAATLVFTGVAAFAFYARSGGERPKKKWPTQPPGAHDGHNHDEHAGEMGPMTAYFEATGDTPCETAYNGMTAEAAASASHGDPPHFRNIAPRDVFLARCQALSPLTQECLTPRYFGAHKAECWEDMRRLPRGTFHGMYEMVDRRRTPEMNEYMDRVFSPPDNVSVPEEPPTTP